MSLLDDFEIPTEYFDPAHVNGQVFFWFGPGGTVTPLHHDVVNVLFVQMYGRKISHDISGRIEGDTAIGRVRITDGNENTTQDWRATRVAHQSCGCGQERIAG